MSKSGRIQCAKCGHILSLDEIAKGQCNRCKAINAGIFPDKEDVKRKPRKPLNGVNLDNATLEEIRSRYEAQKPSDANLTNERKGLSGCLVFVIIVFALVLITVGLYYLLH